MLQNNLRVWKNSTSNTIWEIERHYEDSGLLLNVANKTIEHETEKQRYGIISIFLGTLGAILLRNLLSGKRLIRASNGVIRVGKGTKKRTDF